MSLLTVLSTDLELTTLVNEADIGRVKIGQEVEFSSSAYSDKIFKGKVQRISPQASTVSNVQYYPVLISSIDPERQLLSGMSVTVNIIVAQQKNVLAVPMMAVSYARTYLKSNPAASQNKSAAAEASKTISTSKNQPSQMSGNTGPMSHSRTKSAANNANTENVSGTSNQSSQLASVVIMKNGQVAVKNVVMGLSDGSNYEVIKGLNEGDEVVVGSTQIDSQSGASGTNSSTSTKTNQNRGSGGMGGSPPGM